LYDLANCLLHRAQDKDARMLDEAIRHYRECCRIPEAGDALRADAAHNLELARLLRLKVRPTKDPANQPKQPEQPNAPPKTPKEKDKGGTEGGSEAGAPKTKQDGQGKQGATEEKKGAKTQQTPGRGVEQTLPDADQLEPLPREDALAHLERIAGRI